MFPDSTQFILTNAGATSSTLLTRTVLDQAAVFVYFKHSLLLSGANNQLQLSERIVEGTANGALKLPGRTTNTFEDYVQYSIFNDPVGLNFLQINVFGRLGPSTSQRVPPALVGKGTAFYRDLFKDTPQYRLVIVNGSTLGGGRKASINFKDYAAVKTAFNLPD